MAERRAKRSAGRRGARAGTGASPPADVRLPVWQFVRLMVEVEETLSRGRNGDAAAVMGAWRDIWSELDAELTRLGEADQAAFAGLMMDQEVVLEEVTPGLARAVAAMLRKVVRTMQASLDSGPPEGQRADDLRFEIRELEHALKGLPGA